MNPAVYSAADRRLSNWANRSERIERRDNQDLEDKTKRIENCGGYLTHDSGLGLVQPRLSGVGSMFRDGESVLQRVQMKVHLPKIMGCIGVPCSSLIPLLKEPANDVTMRIGRYD